MPRTRGKLWRWIGLPIVVGAGALWTFLGTRWTLPSANVTPERYELAGYWDGADVPGGKIHRPMGIAVAPNGDVYVTDARTRVVCLHRDGRFIGQWGREGNGEGEFGKPTGVAVAPDGSVYVSDFDQDRIQKFTADGTFLLAFGQSGDGAGQFDAPAGLSVDRNGFVYVADFYQHRIQKFGPDGTFQQTIGRSGRLGDGRLHYPTGVAVTADGSLLIADAYNYELQWFSDEGRPLRRRGFHLAWLWPRPSSSNKGFNVPTGVAVAPDGLIHVTDSGNHRIVMLSATGGYIAEWKVPDADPTIHSPEQIAISPDGRTLYATDYAADRIIILRRTSPAAPGARS